MEVSLLTIMKRLFLCKQSLPRFRIRTGQGGTGGDAGSFTRSCNATADLNPGSTSFFSDDPMFIRSGARRLTGLGHVPKFVPS